MAYNRNNRNDGNGGNGSAKPRNDFNLAILIGRLGRDPEMRYTPSGKAVCNFSLANNQGYTDSQGEVVQETLWATVTTWGTLAEVVNQYLTKGRKVQVVGKLKPIRTWEDQDGNQRQSGIEISATEVIFFDDRAGGDPNQQTERHTGVIEDDSIPF